MLRLVVVYFAVAVVCSGFSSESAEIVVTKPFLAKPDTRFDEAQLQRQYEAGWQAFSKAAETAAEGLSQELGNQLAKAQEMGNLDLKKYWLARSDQWETVGTFAWDEENERKEWVSKFPNVSFPTSVTRSARDAGLAFQDSIVGLQKMYQEIERSLVRAGKDDQAEQVRKETDQLLTTRGMTITSDNSRGGPEPKLKRAIDRLQGKWSRVVGWGCFAVVEGNTLHHFENRNPSKPVKSGPIRFDQQRNVAVATMPDKSECWLWLTGQTPSGNADVMAVEWFDPVGQPVGAGFLLYRENKPAASR